MSAVPENRFADGHNEGSCDLCTGWHDAEEAAFMNRRQEEGIADERTPPALDVEGALASWNGRLDVGGERERFVAHIMARVSTGDTEPEDES
jgi:hypothetical protein